MKCGECPKATKLKFTEKFIECSLNYDQTYSKNQDCCFERTIKECEEKIKERDK